MTVLAAAPPGASLTGKLAAMSVAGQARITILRVLTPRLGDQFPPRIVKLPLFADQVRLGLLGFGQFPVPLFQHLL